MANCLTVLSVIILMAYCCFERVSSAFVHNNNYDSFKHFITISSQGHDNATCLEASTLNISHKTPCKTLNYAFNSTRNATMFFLEPGVHLLSENATFNEVYVMQFLGRNDSNVTVKCVPEVGFTFTRSEEISIQGITFSHCGRLHKSTVGLAFRPLHKDHVPFHAGVFYAYCRHLSISNVVITNSHGIGLVLYDVGGNVNIVESKFKRNSPDVNNNCTHGDEYFYARSGGGVYVEFTYNGALPPFNQSDTERLKYQSNNNYNFERCDFEQNLAPEQCFMNKIEFPSGDDHMPFGRGGGLSFFIKGTTQNNTITISNCNFFLNGAVWGAGLFVEFQDSSQNNTMVISASNFTSNWNSTAGGGIRTGIPIWKGKLLANKVIHDGCIFVNNSALLGGGVSHYGPLYRPFDEDDNQREVVYKNCKWINNTATLGSAIGLATSALDLPLANVNPNVKGPLLPYKVHLENCRLENNQIIRTEDKVVIGQGALYSYTVPLVVKDTHFENNNNTALVLDGAILKVFDSLSFINNTGMSGGAIGMYGTSVIDLMPGSSLLFRKNQAQEKGGAIFVDGGGPPVVAFKTTEINTHPCFLAYNDIMTLQDVDNWKTNITFDTNTASVGGGNSVYATTLQGCRRLGEGRTNNESLQWKSIVHYLRDDNQPQDIGLEVSTDPISIHINRSDWQMSPGEEFGVTIKLIGEKNSPVQGVVKLDLKGHNSELGIPSPLLLIKDLDGTNKVPGLSIKGTCDSIFNLTLRTVSGQSISRTENDLQLSKCNPGFHLDGNECVCSKKDIIGISRCTEDKRNVYIKDGYWAGIVPGQRFDTFACPSGYCNEKNNNFREREYKFVKRDLCESHRNSSVPLCGKCDHDYTVSLGSEQCLSTKHCNKERLWLLLVFFLGMLVFVLLVLKIDVDLFTAYLNVWLYSYQIIMYLIKENEVFDAFISFVIGLANWRIHVTGLCFIPGLTDLTKLGINYILPFYVLFLLLVLSKISKFFPRCYINNNVSHALCNLLVLCYTDITTISFSILHYVHVGGKYVLFLNGDVDFVEDWKTHLPLTILAIFLVIFFVILFPMTLLFTPWFFEKFPFLVRYRLFFDLFQSCFDDRETQRKHRWFAAFYFFCRIWIILMAMYLPLGPLKRSILEASCIVVLATLLYLQPYNTKYKWLNTTDAILLGNLCLITVFSSALNSDAAISTIKGLKVFINILAYVPLVYFVILTVYYGRKYLRENRRTPYVRLNDETTDDDKSRESRVENEAETSRRSHPL